MDRAAPLTQRLIELGVGAHEILESVRSHGPEVVLLYTSHLEGLGTAMSDLDCYVIMKSGASLHGVSSKTVYVGDAEIDLEFHTLDEVKELYDSLVALDPANGGDLRRLDFAALKVAHRLQVAVPILGDETWASLMQEGLRTKSVGRCLCATYANWADEILSDAVKFLEVGDYESACFHAGEAIAPSVLAYLAASGVSVVKEKWMWRKLVQTFGQQHELVNKIRSLRMDGSGFGLVEKNAENIIQLCQNLITRSQLMLR